MDKERQDYISGVISYMLQSIEVLMLDGVVMAFAILIMLAVEAMFRILWGSAFTADNVYACSQSLAVFGFLIWGLWISLSFPNDSRLE